MGKYLKQPVKKRRKGWIIALVVLLLLLLPVGIAAGYIWHKLDLIQYAGEPGDLVYASEPTAAADSPAPTEEEPGEIVNMDGLDIVETAPPVPEGEAAQDNDVQNILLIGTDERSKQFSTNARSDSMILVSINKKAKTVKLVSLERGMGVPILDGEYEGKYDWLTHIFRYGGAELLVRTVEHCFKVEVEDYVRLNFNSVTQIVDTIGGIDLEYSRKEAEHMNLWREPGNKLVAGVNHVNGTDALAFARLRSIDSDWQRVGRQRKVILAVVERLKGSSLATLDELAETVLPMIQTNLTKLEIAELLLYAPTFLQSTFDQMTIPQPGTYRGMTVMGGRGSFAIDYEVNNAILHDFLYGTEERED